MERDEAFTDVIEEQRNANDLLVSSEAVFDEIKRKWTELRSKDGEKGS